MIVIRNYVSKYINFKYGLFIFTKLYRYTHIIFMLMRTLRLFFLWVLPCCSTGEDGVFECGAHGRFEYCIDGIPGCVIGCHCHPGYYFDTETKICEPNTKLITNYRRQYMPEPTRVPNTKLLLNNVEILPTLPTLTTVNVIDEHVNDITKNADDLGDWLYNQFFKTIENQVINNTNKDSRLTRRSGRGSKPKLKRRAKKKTSKRRRKKKKNTRGKLLGIAEDDSLFQTSDSSESDSDSSDSSRSYSSDTDTDNDSNESHGHRKILMINKVQKPPLPSLLFLPNMNTPFFPPIGLPPPPVMPMYPVVPVPPVMPYPYPGPPPPCVDNVTDITTVPTTKITTEDLSTTTELITESTTDPQPSTDNPSNRNLAKLKNKYRGKKMKRLKSVEHFAEEDEDPPFDMFESSKNNQKELIKRLRQRMNDERINKLSSRQKTPFNFDDYFTQLTPPDTLMANGEEDVVLNNNNFPSVNLEEKSPQDNVDFKYLSQLIHKVNDNQTQDPTLNPQETFKISKPRTWPTHRYRDLRVPVESGRRMDQHINNPRNAPSDDSYYSNLGRQIATMIRTMDADNERQFNIEIEKFRQKPNDHPFFNENGPRTFWERSVRSPLQILRPFKNRFDYLKNSNEQLFNIENKVEIVASTTPTLSLHEIENMIKVMAKVRTQFGGHSKIKNLKPSVKTLNINLWPQEIKQSKISIKSSDGPNASKINRKFISYSNNTRPEILNTEQKNMRAHNLPRFIARTADQSKLKDDFSRRGLQVQPFFRNETVSNARGPHTKNNHLTLHSSEQYPRTMDPTLLSYKKVKKYFFDDNNQYSFQNDNLRLHYSAASRASRLPFIPSIQSPYFHQEINHIDYIPYD